jgi:hypothetical protein|uniref:Mitochondrial import inner membrane translocase subunit TIM22 n=1 Tax=Attheya septentrionalis TaxID=420275 RepID=A0A7S2U7N1_9STRA|mmetsp:Transcript_12290/g.22298  ORF Transcript_12290/g.22298 Transcript_12290/m.22298 type:complete len:207 (+) Transcript_12290:148-768(+)
MSAWERTRHIPWTRVQKPQIPGDEEEGPEKYKQRVFRELRREATEEEMNEQLKLLPVGEAAVLSGDEAVVGNIAIKYKTPDFIKQTLFGAVIGSMTGGAFGFMDGMRTAGESEVLKKASNAAKGRYLLQGTTRSAATFGAFFGGFHALKYLVKVNGNNPGDVVEIGVAGAISLGALAARSATRASLPYATMLIGMDSFNMYYRYHR